MVRDRSSLCEGIVDGTWVFKRKRKRSSSSADISNKEEHNLDASVASNAPKGKLKHRSDFSLSSKIKGHDGYYFECVECDIGGDLLCCDSCPRTYHLECLDPPLECAPPGRWQCPVCSKEVGNMKTSNKARSHNQANLPGDLKINLRRKSMEERKAPCSNGSSVIENRGSSDSRKSSYSQLSAENWGSQVFGGTRRSRNFQLGSSDGKSKQSVGCGARDGYLSSEDDENGKRTLPLSHLKSSMEDQYLDSRLSKSKVSVKRCGGRLDKFVKEKNSVKSSHSVGSFPRIRKNKKQNSKKPETRRSRMKQKDVLRDASDDSSVELPESCDEDVPEETNFWSGSKEKKLGVQDKKCLKELIEDEIIRTPEDLQVDRILGCRLKIKGDTRSSCVTSEQCPGRTMRSLESEFISDDDNMPQTGTAADKCHDEAGSDKKRGPMETADLQDLKPCQNNELLSAEKVEEEILQSSNYHSDKITSDAPGGIKVSATSSSHNINMGTSIYQRAGNAENGVTMEGSDTKNSDGIIYEFLVKWVGKSNIHNSWILESDLKILAKRKLENYKAKYGTSLINICNEQWLQPQRVIALRDSVDGFVEVLVKWRALSYDECTWERVDEPVMARSAHLISEFKQIELDTLDKGDKCDNAYTRSDSLELNPLTQQPKEMQGGSLFPHQLEALNWLRKCWFRCKNVILADEMGLGKTVSACAFLSSLYCEFKVILPCLVLVPLSTMPNWLAEFALWAPHLNVVEYHGSAKARSVIRQYEWHANNAMRSGQKTASYKFNVLLTTYEMVLADSSHLRSVPWEVLIVDEGHRLKNSSSKLFGLLNSFSFQHRVLLTGTPLQNNIGEMYNLLNFLQPSSFPSLTAFEEKFNDLSTAEKVEELKKLVAPHMLRRLKKDAMQNIPPKTERMVPVELTSIQAEYYRAMLTKNYQVLRNIGKGGAQQSLLNIIMQLRKVCNHPYLIPGTEPESGSIEFLHEMRIKASAKLTLLHHMLKLLHRDGHRVLIFSQMTKLLDILEDYMTVEFGSGTFERVDGSVSVGERQAAITRFNEDKTRFVFLLSTRSCGLGINLATADTVVIYDSDFNPHADIQAMNRAHRIGQSNRLLVYRLFVRASVEERILQLAKRKLMLDQLFVNKSESLKEVEDILSWGTEELFTANDRMDAADTKDLSCRKNVAADTDLKHGKRTGGLGDVYEDKCAAGSTNIQWDENAIVKLLDRSTLQTAAVEGVDADMDSDYLGSVKSVDWNDEFIDEQPNDENSPCIITDGGEQQFEATKAENTSNDTVENEWDRLLRARWEKYQVEEEAALGRGKRLRKAVSYKETFTSCRHEALLSSSEEDESVREYTPAGRALKEKYIKLRARQKERIAQRHNTLASTDYIRGEEYLHHSPTNELARDICGQMFTSSALRQCIELKKNVDVTGLLVCNNDDVKSSNLPDPNSCRDQSGADMRLRLKQAKRKHREVLESGNPQSLMAYGDLSPVLGLCAPNADQMLSTRSSQQSVSIKEQRRATDMLAAETVPSAPVPDHSNIHASDGQMGTHSMLLSDSVEVLERLKNIIPENYFPFKHVPPISGKDIYGALSSSVSSMASFREKMGPQSMIPDDDVVFKKLKNLPDFLPSLSLNINKDSVHENALKIPDITAPLNFLSNIGDVLKHKHEMCGFPAVLDISGAHAEYPSMPGNHKKVLDSIMSRANYATAKLSKKRRKMDFWSEEELDTLWIGVRRHGRENWDAMLKDPKLKLLGNRTAQELASRWTEERKILEEPMLDAPKSGISAPLSAPLGGTFTKSRTDPMFLPQYPDGHLCRNDGKLVFPFNDPLSYINTGITATPTLNWRDSLQGSSQRGESSHGVFHKLDKSHNGFVPSLQLTPTRESTHYMVANYSNASVWQNDVMDMNIFRPSSVNLMDPSGKSAKNPSSSSLNTGKSAKSMPHWLQDALCGSVSKSAQSDLPPNVSAISLSIHLLFGGENPVIPQFRVPGPPLSQPQDPRISLRKRKLKKSQEAVSQMHTSALFNRHIGVAQKSPDSSEHNDAARLVNLNTSAASLEVNTTERVGVPLLPQPKEQSSIAVDCCVHFTSEPSDTILETTASTMNEKEVAVDHFNAVSEGEELPSSSCPRSAALSSSCTDHLDIKHDSPTEELRHTRCLENLEDNQFFLNNCSSRSVACSDVNLINQIEHLDHSTGE